MADKGKTTNEVAGNAKVGVQSGDVTIRTIERAHGHPRGAGTTMITTYHGKR